MSGRKRNKSRAGKARRTSFVQEEKSRPWLSLLLEGYFIIDRGVAGAIEKETHKGKKLACTRGCSHCCSAHANIPVYPLELIGITWYVTEKMKGPVRDSLRGRLAEFTKGKPCPFLVDSVCAVHPVRPMACRQFNVFGTPCSAGEDPFYSRRDDVMNPVRKHVDQAFFIMLPYYGIEKESERRKVVETGSFHRMVRDLFQCNWKELAEKMERYDRRDKEGAGET